MSCGARLARAKERLDALDYYPEPVRIQSVRVVVASLFFRLLYPRFAGLALTRRLILMRRADYSDDLLTHELCHLWQVQQDGLLKTCRAYLMNKYEENPYEVEARMAVVGMRRSDVPPGYRVVLGIER